MDWRWTLWQVHGGETWRQTAACYDFLLESQWAAPEKLAELQQQKLERLLACALDSVPFYRDLGLPARLSAFPVVDRQSFRPDYPRHLATPAPPGKIYNWQSAGSSGEPVSAQVDSLAQAWRRAAMLRGDAWGCSLRATDRQVVLWVSSRDAGSQQNWRARLYDYVYNRYVFNRVDMNAEQALKLNRALHRLRPRMLVGYASVVEAYARFASAAGLQPPPMEKVMLTSETCLEPAQQELRDFFGCSVMDRYGAAELGPIAHRCEQGTWHLHSENLLLEVRQADGSISPSGYGSLLATSLDNRAMPLIRYEIGDMVDLTPVPCTCGRGLPTMSLLDGRLSEQLFRPDGGWLSPWGFIMPLRRMAFSKYRVVQEDERTIEVQVQGSEPVPAEMRAEVERLFHAYLGEQMQLRIRLVEKILPLSNGKDPIVINKLHRRAAGLPVPQEP
ncbi:phenylacetate--CoA ligase family protein [bacterium]|nr:phenylacetate--CoA ligase family protein [bacterium]